LKIGAEEFTKYQPKLIVKPGSLKKVDITDENGVNKFNSLNAQTVDEPFVGYFRGVDSWGNMVKLVPEKGINSEVFVTEGKAYQHNKEILVNGILKITF